MKKPMKTMDVVLAVVFTILVVFTIAMIVIFCRYGQIPDTLVTCVFGALAGECGIMGWIKTSKVRHEDRSWQKEDEREEKAYGCDQTGGVDSGDSRSCVDVFPDSMAPGQKEYGRS